MSKKIIGVTDWHGLYDELSLHPPAGYDYKPLPVLRKGSPWLRSPVKGFMSKYDFQGVDIVESVINLVDTKLPWVHSLACLQESVSFSFWKFPLPKDVRIAYASHLFSRANCKALLFWSQSGLDTVKTYGNVNRGVLLDKAKVVYPSVRFVDTDSFTRPAKNTLDILFSGDFFRKGGINVVDAFENLQERFPMARLRLCCDYGIDFNTGNTALRDEYIQKIESNPRITIGRVPREVMMGEILPQADVYLLPTYSEAFGYAVLEAMAYGVPVIATNHMAIPELYEHKESGFLIDIQHHDYRQYFRGYSVNEFPEEFKNDVTGQLTEYLGALLESEALRKEIGKRGQDVARGKFSVEQRNKVMAEIYG